MRPARMAGARVVTTLPLAVGIAEHTRAGRIASRLARVNCIGVTIMFDLQAEVRRRAVHEAGHAVFIWRGDAGLPPFEEVLVSPHAHDRDENLPPLRLADGRLHYAAGTVILRDLRQRVPDVRGMTGLSRKDRRAAIKRAKAEADAAVVGLLAGPVVEEHFRALRDGDGRYFNWEEEAVFNETGERSRDVTEALAIVEKELCRGWRQSSSYMDAAVARIEEKIDTDPRYLRAIHAVAGALEKRHRLDRYEAFDTMREAWNSGAACTAENDNR